MNYPIFIIFFKSPQVLTAYILDLEKVLGDDA